MNPAEASVAEDAEDVAFLRLTDDVFHDEMSLSKEEAPQNMPLM